MNGGEEMKVTRFEGNTSLGENIYQARTSRHMSQDDLAKAVGTSKKTISNYESGVCLPGTRQLCALADFFGMRLDDLVGRKTPA